MIDLRSDTVTKPSPGMLDAMLHAQVGDDVFGEDPTVNELQDRCAELFGMQAGLFCASGTLANQIAIKVHTQPLEEIIAHKLSHINNYEVGGHAFHSGVSLKLTEGARGIITKEEVINNINPDYDWLPVTRMVWLENTCNKAGGSCFTMEQLKEIHYVCQVSHLRLHMDGARIFNALQAKEQDSKAVGACFDSISFCFSKGLGTPVGSMLVGSKEFIRRARRIRKVMGGGMRQAGYLAAAAIYALDHNIERLDEDHKRAKVIEAALQKAPFVKEIYPAETNILMFELIEECKAKDFLAELAKHNIKAIQLGPNHVRMVTHLDITEEMVNELLQVLEHIGIHWRDQANMDLIA